jgi:endonuclease/exonuclease/phosphatase family metal-dependent hydrolase
VAALGSHTPRTWLGRWFSRVSWVAALGLLLIALSWPVSHWAWGLDLIANFNAQWLAVAAPLALLWLTTYRLKQALLAIIAAALLIVSLVPERAAIWPRPAALPRDAAAAAADPLLVRFFHINASTDSTGDEIEQCMDASGADVLSVLCPSVGYQREVIYGPRLADRFAGKLTRHWRPEPDGRATDITAAFLVSRWPLTRIDTSHLGASGDYLLAAMVERPSGPFAVIAVHPRSPRSPRRWAVGNAVTESIATLSHQLRDQGRAVVVLTDLNATPSGWRSRRLEDAGLRRAKPLLVATGTYPIPLGPGDDTQAGPRRPIVWPLGIAIDDALLSPEVELVGWSVMDRLESEHCPIVIDARIPAQSAPSPSSSGR